MSCKPKSEFRAKTIHELENIKFSIEQASSVAIAVSEALHGGLDGESYASGLYLASTTLNDQLRKIDKLINTI